MSSFYLDSLNEKQSVGALALGSFDGVHRGHSELLQKTAKMSSDKFGLPAGALSFSPNPKQFFSTPQKPFLQIYSHEQNLEEIMSEGVESVFTKKFDKDCSLMSSESFLDFVLSKIQFSGLTVGFDFKFGKGRSGNHKSLKTWCLKNNIELFVMPAVQESGEKISSTRIKNLLLQGSLKEAGELLGKPHSYTGSVRSDQGLGTKIGFPTLNIPLNLDTAIARGVYFSSLKSADQTYLGLSNLGLRPTVFESAENLVLETHIFGSELINVKAGDKIRVELKKFLRPEKKFANLENLKTQIATDLALAKSLAK